MSESDTLLVRALGAADAVRLPVRFGQRYYAANRMAGLRLIDSTGVPLAVGGSATSRVSGSRLLAELEERGFIRTSKASGAKLVSVALTEAGDLTARALCGLPTRAEARGFLEHLAAVERRCQWAERCGDTTVVGAPFTGAERWLGEDAVLGDGYDAPRERMLGVQELFFCAAAARGWVLSHSIYDTGNAAYALTAAGRAELAHPTAPPVLELPAHDPAAEVLYGRARDEKLRDLEAAVPAPPGEIGTCPLATWEFGFLPGTDFEDDDDDKPAKKPAKARRKR